MTSSEADRPLLIRDLAQVVSPSGSGAPLRGAELGKLDVVEDAYILCEGSEITAVGRMRELPAVAGEMEELDGRGRSAIPGLVDCHTHPCFAGDRVEEFALRAAGASYEELHAAGGGILATVRATRAAGEAGLAKAVARHRGWMLRHGTTTFEGKSGYGLDRETELASLRAIRDEGGVATWLGAHAVPPEFESQDAYLDFALTEVLPAAAELAEAADVFLERGAFDVDQARRYLTACRAAGLTLRLHGDQFTEQGAIPWRSSSAPAPSTTSKRPATLAFERSRRVTSSASSCPRARSSWAGRCHRAARLSTQAPPSLSRPISIQAAPSARACR